MIILIAALTFTRFRLARRWSQTRPYARTSIELLCIRCLLFTYLTPLLRKTRVHLTERGVQWSSWLLSSNSRCRRPYDLRSCYFLLWKSRYWADHFLISRRCNLLLDWLLQIIIRAHTLQLALHLQKFVLIRADTLSGWLHLVDSGTSRARVSCNCWLLLDTTLLIRWHWLKSFDAASLGQLLWRLMLFLGVISLLLISR